MLTPKRAILSARTSSIAPHLPANILFTSNSTAGLLLALVLLHEYLLGTAGPWWDYLQSLPHALAFPAAPRRAGEEAPPQLRQMPGVPGSWGVPIPLLWPAHSEEWRWIAGAESARMVQRANADPHGKIEGNGMSLVSRYAPVRLLVQRLTMVVLATHPRLLCAHGLTRAAQEPSAALRRRCAGRGEAAARRVRARVQHRQQPCLCCRHVPRVSRVQRAV